MCKRFIVFFLCVISLFCFSFASHSQLFANDFLDYIFGSQNRTSGFYQDHERRIVRFSRRFRPGHIVVSFSDRRLYFIKRRGLAISYPVAIPSEDREWAGVHQITDKRINPRWTPTVLMRFENPNLPKYIPGGHPRNPMGPRALYLGNTLYRIHGTDAPRTIGRAVSKGCIRMYNIDIIDLYERVSIGTHVHVTWQRFRG